MAVLRGDEDDPRNELTDNADRQQEPNGVPSHIFRYRSAATLEQNRSTMKLPGVRTGTDGRKDSATIK